MVYNAIDIAKHILKLSNPEVGDIISNLKLQKLLYYTQGFHFAMTDEPLFKEDIYAWQYGPVVPEVYHEFKYLGSGAIPVPEDQGIQLDEKISELIADVFNVYGQYSALKLMDMTHNETPWKETPVSDIIKPELLKAYFKPLIQE